MGFKTLVNLAASRFAVGRSQKVGLTKKTPKRLLIPIAHNKCACLSHFHRQASPRESAAKRSREIFLNRFLHFGPLRGPPVEMTKAQILNAIGIIQRLRSVKIKFVHKQRFDVICPYSRLASLIGSIVSCQKPLSCPFLKVS